MKTTYKQNGAITIVSEYRPAGYSALDASAVYAEYRTAYSIPHGVIVRAQFAGYITADGKPYTANMR